MKTLWGCKIGDESWQEQLITEVPERIESARKWALANGFDRLRVADINLDEKPDFTKTINKAKP